MANDRHNADGRKLNLLPQHRALIEASGISSEVAAARGYFSATDASGLIELGFRDYQARAPALVVPVHDVTGAVAFYQIRPDHPRLTKAGKEIKYETPAGTQLCVDVPRAIRNQLTDPAVPLWITEGARKADAAVSVGLCCVALLGVWGWRGTNEDGGKTALPDWEAIALDGREVFIAFDSDVMTKEAVNLALERLARFLESRGSRVRPVYIPSGEDGKKVGLDDFIAAGGTVDELLSVATDRKSLRSKPENSAKKPSQREKIADLLEAEEYELFHTPGGEPFVSFPVDDHWETHALTSRAVGRWLAFRHFKEYGTSPPSNVVNEARLLLEGRALFEGPERETFTRIATGREGAIYLDLCDQQWRAVRIDATGWTVIPRAPTRFRRAGGMLALPTPKCGGSLEDLGSFVNIANDDDFALLVGWLVGAARGRGPYMVMVLQGEQGSAKSTTTRTLRRLLDPNKAELRAQPLDPRDLAIACNNAWIMALDNLSGVQNWLSDALCRVATGGGFATRLLYTDSEEAIFDSQRPIILNGIDSIATRGDLLDRAILLNLPRLTTVRVESEFWGEFEAARPRLLGALLTAVSVALRRESEVELSTSVRMADAARWVVAAEPVLPWDEGTFLSAYAGNRAEANELALEASPVAAAMQQWIKGRAFWSGTAGELLGELEAQAPEQTKRLKSWPKSARGLSSALRRLAPNFRAIGIAIEFSGREGHERRRVIRIEWLPNKGNDRPHRPHSDETSSAAKPCASETGDVVADDREQRQGEPSADRPHVTPRTGDCSGVADDADGSVGTGASAEDNGFDEFLL